MSGKFSDSEEIRHFEIRHFEIRHKTVFGNLSDKIVLCRYTF